MHSLKQSQISCILALDTPSNTTLKGTLSSKSLTISSKYSNYITFLKLKLSEGHNLQVNLRESYADYGYGLSGRIDLLNNAAWLEKACLWHYGYFKTTILYTFREGLYPLGHTRAYLTKEIHNFTIAAKISMEDYRLNTAIGVKYCFGNNIVYGKINNKHEFHCRLYMKMCKELTVGWNLYPVPGLSINLSI